MNILKYLLTTILISASIFFYSCGDDKAESGIQYRESSMESISVYVGSPSGGQELHSDSIKKKFDIIFPTTLFEEYAKTYFIFLDDTSVAVEQGDSHPEINKYIFEKKSLYLFNNDILVYYGEGDTRNLNIRQHYVAYKGVDDNAFTAKQITPRKTVNKEDAALVTPFATIENMKSTKDTLVWCTRSSIFR